MPLPEGTRYRFKKLKSGKYQRLAFAPKSNKVIEVKIFKRDKKTGKLKPASMGTKTDDS